jgi:hypothetical protein
MRSALCVAQTLAAQRTYSICIDRVVQCSYYVQCHKQSLLNILRNVMRNLQILADKLGSCVHSGGFRVYSSRAVTNEVLMEARELYPDESLLRDPEDDDALRDGLPQAEMKRKLG